MERRFDLHLHSNCSDGTDTPEQLMRRVHAAGVVLCALTDHDCVLGVPRAVAEGERLGMRVIRGIEFDTQYPSELHILGLDVDIRNEAFLHAVNEMRGWRENRNATMLEKLSAAGYDIAPYFSGEAHTLTRYHMAAALVEAGYANCVSDAFARFLNPGCVGYEKGRRHTPEETIAHIHAAGGVAVLAHPCAIRGNVHAIIPELCGYGLDGIEAYYPTSTPGQTETFTSMARQYGLLVTAGSDYHGPGRPVNAVGCSWKDVPALQSTYDYFMDRS